MLGQTYAVIMAGGKGQRFWPLSTSKHPKQVIRLLGDSPMITLSVERLRGLIPPERVLVVTGASMVAPIRKALPQLPSGNVVGEPVPRDTAAAVALGTVLVQKRDPSGIVCVLTADHVIGDIPRFRTILRDCASRARAEDVLITIGIEPTFPSTGFGYIESEKRVLRGKRESTRFCRVARFVEKPELARAKQFLASGRYSWNSGMFIWSVSAFRNALQRYRPALANMAIRLLPAIGTKRFGQALAREYAQLEKISVDFAIMEKADNILVARGDFPWSDIGSWSSIGDHFPADDQGNVVQGDCQEVDSSGNIVFSRERLTALVGVKDLVVVQARGATLICAKDKAQDVKRIVDKLERAGQYGSLL